MKRRALLAALLVACCDRGPATQPAEFVEAGRLGRVALLEPDDEPEALVFLFTASPREADAAARQIRDAGAAVVIVDLARYQKGLRKSDDGCHYLISEIEELSKNLQRQLGASTYRSPILAGVGEAGTLVYAALAQSPAATVAGAVSVDPAPVLHTKVPLCPGAPSSKKGWGAFAYGAPKDPLPGFWRVSAHKPLPAKLAELVDTPDAGPPLTDSAYDRLTALVRAQMDERPPPGLRDLPLTVIEADKPGRFMAVIYSGDGGWRDLDKQIGEDLATRGVPVIGVDSLRYFWSRRDPNEIAKDLGAIIDKYGDRFGVKHVVVIGYSFGAAVVPFAVARLPAPLRKEILLVSLLGLGSRVDFQFHADGWLGGEPAEDAPLVLPELKKLDMAKVQCFFGAEEDDTLCRDPGLAGAEVIETKGGHHFDEDYAALAKRIYDAAVRRLPAKSS